MRTHDLTDSAGRLIAFEVSNALLSRHRAQRILRKIPGVTIRRRQRPYQLRSEEHFCEFSLGGRCFVISEPWGDSSRFWIGQRPPEPSAELESLRAHFASA